MLTMAANVRRHVAAAHPSAILTTREMQYCGTRSAVDQELSRLVRTGELIRLTYGVFVRHNHPSPFMPPAEIIQTKAAAFGKNIVSDGREALSQLNLAETPKDKLSFSASGCTTELTLLLHGMRVQLKGVSSRKLQLGDTAPGALLRSLWQCGKKNCSSDLVHRAMQLLNRSEKESIWKLIFLLPAWLKHKVMPLLPQIPFEKKGQSDKANKSTERATAFDCNVEEGFASSKGNKQQMEQRVDSPKENTGSQGQNPKSKPAAVRSFGELLHQFRSSCSPYGLGPSAVFEAGVAYRCVIVQDSPNSIHQNKQAITESVAHDWRTQRIHLITTTQPQRFNTLLNTA